jgi:homoaconitase/3-isopropylmalate dehydratase large subunit
VLVDAVGLAPQVTWGTSPGMTAEITDRVPDPADAATEAERRSFTRALEYMDLRRERRSRESGWIGSFSARAPTAGWKIFAKPRGSPQGGTWPAACAPMVVPGSQRVKAAAEAEGLDRIFTAAGFEWRNPGCSMCLGMNEDILAPGERCASTSNRNFEGRQGRGGRTHLMSPRDGGCGGDRGTTGGCAEPVAVTAPSSSEWTVYGAAIERLPGRILRSAQDDRAGTLRAILECELEMYCNAILYKQL